MVQALGKSRIRPGLHDANDEARTQRFQPRSPPRGGRFPRTVTPILPRQALSAGAPPDLTEQIPLAASEGAHPAHTSILGQGADTRLLFQLHGHHFVMTRPALQRSPATQCPPISAYAGPSPQRIHHPWPRKCPGGGVAFKNMHRASHPQGF